MLIVVCYPKYPKDGYKLDGIRNRCKNHHSVKMLITPRIERYIKRDGCVKIKAVKLVEETLPTKFITIQ